MKKGLFIILLLLLLATIVPSISYAGDVKLTVNGDTVTIEANYKLNFTKLPMSEANWYEVFINKFIKTIEKRYLKDSLKKNIQEYFNVGKMPYTLKDLDFNLTITKKLANVTYLPKSLVSVTGNIVSGDISSILSEDGIYLKVESVNTTNVMNILLEFNITLDSEVSDKVNRIFLVIVANLSKQVNTEASISLYNSELSTFEVISNNVLNVTTPTKIIIIATKDYILNNTIWVRINITDTQTYPSTLVYLTIDYISVIIEFENIVLEVSYKLTITGISKMTWKGRVIDTGFRCIKPDLDFEFRGYILRPCRILFIDLTPLAKPLKYWKRHFNGTHTIFELNFNYTLVTHNGYLIELEPTAYLIVEGEAYVEDDNIIVKVPSAYLYDVRTWIIIASVLIIVLLALLYIRLAKKSLILRPRRYIRIGK